MIKSSLVVYSSLICVFCNFPQFLLSTWSGQPTFTPTSPWTSSLSARSPGRRLPLSNGSRMATPSSRAITSKSLWANKACAGSFHVSASQTGLKLSFSLSSFYFCRVEGTQLAGSGSGQVRWRLLPVSRRERRRKHPVQRPAHHPGSRYVSLPLLSTAASIRSYSAQTRQLW